MPELPEVENIKLSLSQIIIGKKIKKVVVRETKLRWSIPKNFSSKLINQKIIHITRKGKYLIIELSKGFLVIHFGMSGHIKLLSQHIPSQKHDHFDLILSDTLILRYHDPRKFGGIQYFNDQKILNKLFVNLGPEPLSKQFCSSYLYEKCKQNKAPIKKIIMNNKIVCGIGNIYANESLFLASILPAKKGYQITKKECAKLLIAIKKVLNQAILYGGTTLKDFKNPKGQIGKFQQKLLVYGRNNQNCLKCKNSKISQIKIGQRSSFFCYFCQK